MAFIKKFIISKFFKPQDIHAALEPLVFACRTFGIAPIYFNRKKKEFKISKFGIVATFITIMYFYSALFYVIDITLDKRFIYELPVLSFVGHCFQLFLGVSVMTVIFVAVRRTTRKSGVVITKIIAIDNVLRSIGILVSYQNLNYLTFGMAFIGYMWLTMSSLYYMHIYSEVYGGAGIPVSITYLIPYCVCAMVLYQFSTSMFIVQQRFSLINKYLNSILHKENSKASASNDDTDFLERFYESDTKLTLNSNKVSYGKRKVMQEKQIYLNFPNYLADFHKIEEDTDSASRKTRALTKRENNSFFIVDSTDEVRNLENKIKTLLRLHSELCDRTLEISEIFSVPFVVIMSLLYCVTVFNLYMGFKIFPNIAAWGLILFQVVLSNFLWGVFFVAVNQFVLYTCTNSIKEAKLSALIVHQMMQDKIAPCIKMRLIGFSLEILHRDLAVTIWDMYYLDYTFVFANIASGTYYLIILLQFDQSMMRSN